MDAHAAALRGTAWSDSYGAAGIVSVGIVSILVRRRRCCCWLSSEHSACPMQPTLWLLCLLVASSDVAVDGWWCQRGVLPPATWR